MKLLATDVTAEGAYPPGEDSFLLIEAIAMGNGCRFLDIGTGSGIVAINAYKNGAEIVIGTDINRKALQTAVKNVSKYNARIDMVCTDVFKGIRLKEIDVLAFNPPYLPYDGWSDSAEEDLATIGGEKGSEAIEKFLGMLSDADDFRGDGYFIYSSLAEPPFGKFPLLKFSVVGSIKLGFEEIFALRASRHGSFRT